MIERMPSLGPENWSVYILRCGDGSLYTGIAKDILKRLDQHSKGKGAAYTKMHPPVHLVYQEGPYTRSQALVREAQLKRYPKTKKENLVQAK